MANINAERFWVPHPDHVWVPGELISTEGDITNFTTDECGGKAKGFAKIPSKDVKGLLRVEPEHDQGVDDICALSTMSEGIMLHTARVRYAKKIIYTRVARTLIAVNPFEDLPIYAAEYLEQYRAAVDSLDEPPHIYGISQDALAGVRNSGKDQAILISGESGAGKTESAKLILSFVADCLRSEEGGIEERVLQTNPVLEAFGNAMTVRNNNSSRFGKWLDLRCADVPLRVQGCQLTQYLLETMRVTKQAADERGFHIFYQMLQARKSSLLLELNLHVASDYRYLKEGQLVAPGIDDADSFAELQASLKSLGFSEKTMVEIFRILAAILVLGNCNFSPDGDASKLTQDGFQPASTCASHLKVDPHAVERNLLFKKLTIGKESTETALTINQAQAARDGMARMLYGRLFIWMIQRINESLKVTNNEVSSSERLLGVLDIAGFESFVQNSLEQLMINLSNEHLQQYFIKMVFKEELDDCAREGIDGATSINFSDNSDVLALLDGKTCILDILDETNSVPKATDMTFVTKMAKQHEGHPRLVISKVQKCGFAIKHFAGNVNYTCDGWLEKNADRPPDNLPQLFKSSQLPVLQEMGQMMIDEEALAQEASAAKGKAKSKAKSVTSGFRTSLRSLLAKISTATPHYVRCIKPNMMKVPGRFDSAMAMEQMLLSGILTTVQIRQQGFAYRIPIKLFVVSYRCIGEQLGKKKLGKLPKKMKALTPDDLKAQCQEIIKVLPECLPSFGDLGDKMFAVGFTKVFTKLDAFKAIEDGRRHALGRIAIQIQRIWRGVLARRELADRKVLNKDLNELIDKHGLRQEVAAPPAGGGRKSTSRKSSASASWSGPGIVQKLGSVEAAQKVLAPLDIMLTRAEKIGFNNGEVKQAERIKRRMLRELDALEEIEKIKKSTDVIEVEKALAKARAMNLVTTDVGVKLEERLNNLNEQLPFLKAMKAALEKPQPQESEMKEILERATGLGLQPGSVKWMDVEGLKLIEEIDAKIKGTERRKTEILRAELAAAEKADDASGAEKKAKLEAELAAKDAEAAGIAGETQGEKKYNSRKTVTGLDSLQQEQVLNRLRIAAEEYDVPALEKWIRRAAEDGITDTDDGSDSDDAGAIKLHHEVHVSGGTIAKAKHVFESLQAEMFLLGALDQARTKSQEPDPPLLVLKQLENLSRHLATMPGYENEAKDASKAASAGLTNRRQRCLSVFQTGGDAEENELASKVFEHLSNYPGLKPIKGWAGHNPSLLGAGDAGRASIARRPSMWKATGKEEGKMLNHCKMCLYESLTEAPDGVEDDEWEGGAILNFRNILVCMGDRPSQGCQRNASRAAILELARQDTDLRCEIYLQVMKQLTKNPTPRSAQLGWELLLRLCQQSPPKQELVEFVRFFITTEETQQELGGSVGIAKACLVSLESPHEVKLPEEVELAPEDLAAMAERVTQRLDEAAATLSSEVYRLSGLAAWQAKEIQRLNFDKGKQAAEIAALSGKAQKVADQLEEAAHRLVAEKNHQAGEIERLKALLANARDSKAAKTLGAAAPVVLEAAPTKPDVVPPADAPAPQSEGQREPPKGKGKGKGKGDEAEPDSAPSDNAPAKGKGKDKGKADAAEPDAAAPDDAPAKGKGKGKDKGKGDAAEPDAAPSAEAVAPSDDAPEKGKGKDKGKGKGDAAEPGAAPTEDASEKGKGNGKGKDKGKGDATQPGAAPQDDATETGKGNDKGKGDAAGPDAAPPDNAADKGNGKGKDKGKGDAAEPGAAPPDDALDKGKGKGKTKGKGDAAEPDAAPPDDAADKGKGKGNTVEMSAEPTDDATDKGKGKSKHKGKGDAAEPGTAPPDDAADKGKGKGKGKDTGKGDAAEPDAAPREDATDRGKGKGKDKGKGDAEEPLAEPSDDAPVKGKGKGKGKGDAAEPDAAPSENASEKGKGKGKGKGDLAEPDAAPSDNAPEKGEGKGKDKGKGDAADPDPAPSDGAPAKGKGKDKGKGGAAEPDAAPSDNAPEKGKGKGKGKGDAAEPDAAPSDNAPEKGEGKGKDKGKGDAAEPDPAPSDGAPAKGKGKGKDKGKGDAAEPDAAPSDNAPEKGKGKGKEKGDAAEPDAAPSNNAPEKGKGKGKDKGKGDSAEPDAAPSDGAPAKGKGKGKDKGKGDAAEPHAAPSADATTTSDDTHEKGKGKDKGKGDPPPPASAEPDDAPAASEVAPAEPGAAPSSDNAASSDKGKGKAPKGEGKKGPPPAKGKCPPAKGKGKAEAAADP